MNKLIIQYAVSCFFILAGLICLLKALAWKKNEIEKHKEFKHPLPRNYGPSYLIFLGVILVIIGVSFLFMQKK